eukprot:TRINITY_DN80965_c0_g1_i1.p1 TRINITY_DN80965_c0_g1~~TRINITY_DN80965_c0_g1_i1.p1  ORF type:complete len:254 (+),score=24.28 TRINITY_DN80965_c0_g1_i1:271-1032(+)
MLSQAPWRIRLTRPFLPNLNSLVNRLGAVWSSVSAAHGKVTMLEEPVLKLETAPKWPSDISSTAVSSGSWQAERFEVQGWCSWSDGNSSGRTRGQIGEIHSKPLDCIADEDTKQLIGKPVVYTGKGVYFFVPADKNASHEASDTWKIYRAENHLPHIPSSGTRPSCCHESSPKRKKQNPVMGKLVNFRKHWEDGRLLMTYRARGENFDKHKLFAEPECDDADKVNVKFDASCLELARHISDVGHALRLCKSRN